MLKIREEQFDAFRAHAEQSFEDRMFAHISRCWPVQAAEMTEPKLRLLIRTSLSRAGEHGLKAEYDVGRYIDCAFILGEQFEQDARIPWARATLGSSRSPHDRAEMLWARTKDWLAGLPKPREEKRG